MELPCALPLVLAGLRSATNQVIATATIAGFGFGLGGLGRILYSGYGNVAVRHASTAGTVLVVALVLAVEAVFALLQRRLVVARAARRRAGHVRRRSLRDTPRLQSSYVCDRRLPGHPVPGAA